MPACLQTGSPASERISRIAAVVRRPALPGQKTGYAPSGRAAARSPLEPGQLNPLFDIGLTASAKNTERQLADLLAVQADLKSKARSAGLRAENAVALVDHAFAHQSLPCAKVQRHLGVTYARANRLVGQLLTAGVLRQYGDAVYDREFTAAYVLAVLLR